MATKETEMSTVYSAPPFDNELQPVLDGPLPAFSPALLPEDIPMLRATKFNTDATDERGRGRAGRR